jgi:photosystem II stability/assembly factor-like uncharacterized protein
MYYRSRNKIVKIVTIFSIFVIIGETCSEQTGWDWQYPKPQGNTLHDIFIFDDNTAVAVGDVGTVIKTTDRGNSWMVQHHAGGTSLDLYGVHFIDENIGWVVGGTVYTDKNVLLKTIDRGQSWEEVDTKATLPFYMVHFVNVDTGFVFGEDGLVMRTKDSGDTWDIRLMDDYFEIFRGMFRLLEVTFIDDSTGWLVGGGHYGNQIFKTTDCGETWHWDQKIINPPVWEEFKDVCFIDQNNGFIVSARGRFLKTVDGGETWQVINLSEKYQNENYEYLHSVSFTDSMNGCIVGSGFMLETIDGGQNWTEIASNINTLYKIRYSSNGAGWMVGGNGLIYHKTAVENDWIQQSDNSYEFNSIHFVDEYTGWAVGEDGIILHTTDGGTHWKKQTGNTTVRLTSVYALDENIVWIVGGGKKFIGGEERKISTLIYSKDGGQNWDIKQDLPKTYSFNSIAFQNDSTGWITGTKGVLLKTIDRGNHWAQIPVDVTWNFDTIQLVNENMVWLSFYRGNVLFKTADGGKTWEQELVNNGKISMYSFWCIDPLTAWVVEGYSGGTNIFKTTDSGKNWNPCGSPPMANYNAVQFVSENIGWAAGFNHLNRRSIIIRTSNGGETWFDQNCPSKDEEGLGISSLFLLNKNIGWATAGNGLVKTTNGGSVSVEGKYGDKQEQSNPTNFKLIQNYPNPFNSTTTISFHLSTMSDVTLTIYDILGREIETLVNGRLAAGTHQTLWNASKVASGVYLYQLQTRSSKKAGNEHAEIKKMILIR